VALVVGPDEPRKGRIENHIHFFFFVIMRQYEFRLYQTQDRGGVRTVVRCCTVLYSTFSLIYNIMLYFFPPAFVYKIQ